MQLNRTDFDRLFTDEQKGSLFIGFLFYGVLTLISLGMLWYYVGFAITSTIFLLLFSMHGWRSLHLRITKIYMAGKIEQIGNVAVNEITRLQKIHQDAFDNMEPSEKVTYFLNLLNNPEDGEPEEKLGPDDQ